MTNLFANYALKGHEVKNRLVVPPMVCFHYSHGDGFVTEKNIGHYEEMAKGGSGIVIVEATCVSENGRLHKTQLGIWGDEYIEGLAKIADVIHRHGAMAIIQIHHGGLRASSEVTNDLIAPSAYQKSDSIHARAMYLDEIEDISDDFVSAARRAREAGFDGVELHGCHGYLICQFLSPVVNQREDIYGDDKAKFGVDILKRIKTQPDDSFIVGLRLGGNDPDLKTSVEYAKAFEKAGADYLHISTGFKDYRPADLEYTENEHYNWIVRTGIVIKRNVHIPVILVNGIRTPEQARYIIDENLSDFVAIGRGLLVDSHWINKLQKGEKVRLCLNCLKCQYFDRPEKCPLRRA